MDRHCANAERIAEFLLAHPAVGRVLYPGLPSHPGHDLAARQMRGFGGMVSFTLRGGEETALKVCGLVSIFTLGESLGGVESLIEHPGRMTHSSVAGSPLEVPNDLVRLSVGI
jgi:cystathionine gamma-synthase